MVKEELKIPQCSVEIAKLAGASKGVRCTNLAAGDLEKGIQTLILTSDAGEQTYAFLCVQHMNELYVLGKTLVIEDTGGNHHLLQQPKHVDALPPLQSASEPDKIM